MSMHPVYGRKARIVMWIDGDNVAQGENFPGDPFAEGEAHLAHILRRYYDWQWKGAFGTTIRNRRMGYFISDAAYNSTLKTWSKQDKQMKFATFLGTDLQDVLSTNDLIIPPGYTPEHHPPTHGD
jgi:hypothetical protein